MRRAMGWVGRVVRGLFTHLRERRRLVGSTCAVCVLVGAAGVVVWWVPKRQVAHLSGSTTPEVLFQRENEARQTWAGIIGGLVVLGTLYFTWRRVEAAQRSVEVAQEGQITERFTRAVEQLGDRERVEIRLGGIYALERIARDSKRDHWPIMEVLTAYVRENARWDPEDGGEPQGVAADIQAILTVLGRRRREFERDVELRLDLRGTDLRGAYLDGANLERVTLQGAHVQKGSLRSAQLEGVDLECSWLSRCDLSGANLQAANLRRGSLQDANLGFTRMQEADLRGADLSGAHLGFAGVERALLVGAKLAGAGLVGADLAEADLTGAILDGARLADADLSDARLAGRPSKGLGPASLCRADLRGARLEGADLRGVDLTGAEGLTREQIESAITDETTVLPGYLNEEGKQAKE